MKNAIRISCERSNLKVVRDFVSEYLAALGQSELRVNQIVLAVDEIVANIVIHANAEDASKHLDVRLNVENQVFRIELRDQGSSYSPASYQEPNMPEYIQQGRKGGMGMALVNRLMDRVEFTQHGDYNICRLYKQLI
ncbi:ATP-binding protein [Hymenobacter guriensis]|uniref:ATP-binding protein n=1 Tax=Hymenobacter guriensis TaxID=2793065 RepID=A0ABS0KY92_9BACT|nr:ATP-binding protein [Hymenobacter guriensis]MBG8552847.1 ATP-binding protein [Hymenobacter guriensis]